MGFRKGDPQPWHRQQPIEALFWPKIDRGEEDACWNWKGARLPNGYGVLTSGVSRLGERYAHRIAYVLAQGPIPNELTVDHLCRNRSCCNPAHLEAVPFAENLRRGDSPSSVNRRKVTCKRGHSLTDTANVAVVNGKRVCRICRRDKEQRRYRNARPNADPYRPLEARTTCKQGHLLEGENIGVNSRGAHFCRTCMRATWRRYYHTHKRN